MGIMNHQLPADLPPAFMGHPMQYAMAVFGMLMLCILAVEWLWRKGWEMRERPSKMKTPLFIVRIILILLSIVPIMGAGPDLIRIIFWPDIGPEAREILTQIDRSLDASVWIVYSAAWLIAYLFFPMVEAQLKKEPLELDLWPRWRALIRPLKIGIGIAVIAFGLAYFR